ncbi:uncharacterized protein [Misgurnus anguillicaudatus]|uniref:uncharacterized protein isoform X4 n=1 Tax=Misgurnus anguillicaudatus TaxID=75329 RepID=UPI003CCF15DD
MACAQQSAAEYLRTCRCKLVTRMQNFPLIIENLYQQKVFNDHDVDAVKAERTEFDKARCILDRVIKKGEMASYELLKILDFTRRRTLHPDLHYWISCFSFREDADTVYLLGTKPCQNYQIQLKKKAEDILKKQWQQNSKYLQNKKEANFSYVPLVLETDAVVKTAHCKIKMKCKKFSKLRPKKLTSYIPDKQEALTPEDLLKWKNKNILLIGKPGIGKTTVVQQILKTWTDKDDKKPEYMFYFDESVLSHSSNLVNLESFLFDMNLKPKEKNRREIFQDIEENCENVVIVFDGVSSVHKHFILKKIINRELLPEAKIIITCRSELEDDPLYSDWRSKKVYVQGFSEESIRKYYQMMLGHNPDLLNVVLNNQELFSLSYVPMYAFMIAVFFLFKNDTELKHSHTVTEMYIHIFRDALKKHGRKILGQIDQYISEIKDQLYLMMKNSFSATEQKSLNLPEISGDQTDICSAFLKSITIRDSPTSAVTYCAFLHNTMQEFFSALWLLVNPDEIEKVLKLCQTEENKHMRYVLHFLCGLLGEHNIKLLKSLFSEDQMKKTSDWLIEKLLDTFLQPQNDDTDIDLLYVCQCLYELQSSKACLMFLEKMNHQLDPDVNLDPHQCCALSYVISQSRDKEVYLNVEDCTISDTGMKMILSCSPKIRIKLCDEPLKEIKCLLQFFHKVSQCKQKQQKDEITTSCCCTYFDPKKHKRQDLNRALLDLCSHVKDYESQTGRSLLPALQSVYKQSAPDVWIINLSKRKTSILLEVLKLQTEKKPVKLRNCRDEESQVMSLLHCLPYISQLSGDKRCVLSLVKLVQFRENPDLVMSLFQALDFNLSLDGKLPSSTCRLSEEILQTLAECVYEAQEEEVTRCFLQKVGGDLTSCSFSWEKLHYFLQCEILSITLNLKERDTTLNIREILPFLNKIHFQRMSSTFMLCLIREIYESRSSVFVFSLLSSVKNCINLQSRSLDSVNCAALRFILQHCTAVTLNMMWTSIPEEELESIQTLFSHVSCLSVDRRLLLRMIHCCSSSDVQQEASVVLLSALQHKLDFTCDSALDLTEDTQTLQLTAEDCRLISAVIQRAYKDTQTLTQLSLHDCEINTAGIHQLFSVLHSVKLHCDKWMLLQFLSHVGSGEAESLSQALGAEVDLSQTQLDLQVCRGLALVLDHSEGLTELDLSQCHLTDQSLDLLLPNLHKAEIIDFSGNNITDEGAEKMYNIVSQYSNIKTVRLFNNTIQFSEILYRDPRFEIW